MKTILEILTLSSDYLSQKGIHNSKLQAEYLMGDVLNLSRIQLYQQFDRPLTEKELDICRQRLARRVKGEPLQYIHGEVEFYGCKILLNPHVLIPRQETEILVDKVVRQLENVDLKGKKLWDVCCGSGCIGIALKKKFPDLEVTLSDISPDALLVAKENAALNQVDIEFLQGDLLDPFVGRHVDYFICNPPYIAEYEFPSLDREVRDFEPKMALISGSSGLEIFQRLAIELKNVLKPLGRGWFEMGHAQGPAIYDLFIKAGWTFCTVEKDWSSKDRFFFLENE